MSNLNHLLGQNNSGVENKTPIRKAKPFKFYGITFNQVGTHHPISLAIDFFTKDGGRFGIFNMEISSPVLFDLGGEVRPQSIILKTNSVTITIEGRNLDRVYEYILEQRLVWMKEADNSLIEENNDEAIIEMIKMEEK